MIIIKATENHLPVIQKIAKKTWFHAYSGILEPRQSEYMLDLMYSLKSLKEQINEKSHHYLLAKDGEDYTGYISYELNYEGSGKIKIHKIYVLPEHHRRHIGQLLINEVENIARENSVGILLLDMNKQNKAVHFYNKIGFRIIAEKCIDIGNGYVMDDYILEKEVRKSDL